MIFKMPVRPEKCRCLLHEFRTSLVRTTEIRHVAPDTVEHIAGEDALPSSGIPGFECRFFRIGTCPLRITEGKNTMAGAMRSVLSDMFREAIVEGHIVKNPVEATRIPEIKVARERLQLETYNATRAAAEHMPAWFPLAMDLALVTGQRREDIVNMKFSDVFDNRLYVTQIKTGMKIAIPLSLTLRATGLRLGTVIDRCRLVSRTDFMISAGIRKNSPTGNIHPDGLTKTFVKARKASGVNFSNNPPTFHEIRSLAGRLYKNEHGEVFAQKLLGHTSANTTKLYLDERDDKAYMML